MAVTLVGRSAIATATTGTLTASTTARSGTLSRVAGNLLVVVVNAIGSTSVGTIPTPGGWTKVGATEAAQTLCHTAVFWKIAAGSDAGPAFTNGTTGTYRSMQCVLYELSGHDPVTPAATYGTGTAASANITTLNTVGNVPAAGCYALGGHAVYTGSNATDAWTKSASWTADTTDAATARFHHAWDLYSSPPSGSALSFLGTWATVGTGQSAMEVVVAVAPVSAPAGVATGAGAANGTDFEYAPAGVAMGAGAVTGATVSTGGGTAVAVTATQGGSTANGMALRVVVLTSAATLQNGATAAAGAIQAAAITTTVTGSRVYGAAVGTNGSYTANGSTTNIDNITDGTNGEQYLTFKATALTGTPGSVTIGETGNSPGGCALLEVLPNGTLTEDASGTGVVVNTTGAGPVVTGSFTPPDGALLVALVSSDGGSGVTTFGVSGGGLSWSEAKKQNATGGDYAGVWIAQVPAGAATSAPAGVAAGTGAASAVPLEYAPAGAAAGTGAASAVPLRSATAGVAAGTGAANGTDFEYAPAGVAAAAGMALAATVPVSAVNTYEGGSNGTGISQANSGGMSGTAFDVVTTTGTGTTITYDNTHPVHGTLGGKTHFPAVAATAYPSWTTAVGAQGKIWFRRYLYHTAYPAVNTRIWQSDISGSTLCAAVYLMTDGSLLFANSAGATVFQSAAALAPNSAPYRVEGYVTGSATVGQVELKLWKTSADGALGTEDYTNTSAANVNTGGTQNCYRFGSFASVTQGSAWDLWHDDDGVSPSGYLGPSGVAATSAPAGVAAGAATAAGTAGVGVSAGAAAGAGAVTNATVSAGARAGVATGVGSASAVPLRNATAGVAAGTGSASAIPLEYAPAGPAAGAGVVTGAAVSTTTAGSATAGVAGGAGSVSNATVLSATLVPAGAAAGAGAASATAGVGVSAGVAAGAGAASAVPLEYAPAGVATGAGAVTGATISTATAGAATAGVASGSGSVSNATVLAAILAPTGVAVGAGTALGAGAQAAFRAAAGAAPGTGAGVSPAVTAAATPAAGASGGTGTATNATVSTTTAGSASAGVAAGTGAAPGASVPQAEPTPAAGAGSAPAPTIAVGARAGVATGTGAATGASMAASRTAGVAAGTGTAAGVTATLAAHANAQAAAALAQVLAAGVRTAIPAMFGTATQTGRALVTAGANGSAAGHPSAPGRALATSTASGGAGAPAAAGGHLAATATTAGRP